MSKVNVALIGCGYWGLKLKRYIEADGGFSLACVCNSKTNLDIVWQDKKIQAVVVATPNETHYSIVKAALLGGKSVLCEKPLALRVSECEELKGIAEDKGLVLMVDYTYTFSKALEKAQVLIGSGEIGKVLGFDMTIRQLGRFGRGGVYWLLASHLLAVLDMFVPIKELVFEAKAMVINHGEVETASLSFEGDGKVGVLTVSLNYPGRQMEVVIYGEEGTIRYTSLSPWSLQVDRYERARWKRGLELSCRHRQFNIDEADNLRLMIEAFAKALRGEIGGNVERAIVVTRVLEECGVV